MKRIIFGVFLILNSFYVNGDTTNVVTTPVSINYSVSSNLPINFRWIITGTEAPRIHTSTVGTFRSTPGGSGAPLGSSINSIIALDTATPNCTEIADVLFTCVSNPEFINIPADVLATLDEIGLTTIYYNRTFSDGVSATGSIQINLINSPATNPERTLHITRESLRFNDNTIVKVIKPNSRISAIAELNFTGTGLLDAFWEYATPASTRGRAIFIRLGSVRRYLGVGGRVILQSPPLPTDLTGQYVLRLQIRKTLSNPNGVEFTSNLPDGLPLLRYSVNNQGGSDVVYELPPIKTFFPAGNATLQTDTRFNWQAVKNAKAYQLELYLPDEHKRPIISPSTNINDRRIDDSVIENKKPSTGLLIPATKTSLALSVLSRKALKRGSTYYWRIIAIGIDGRILTTSSLKQIRTP
jgi:hypothetical protein